MQLMYTFREINRLVRLPPPEGGDASRPGRSSPLQGCPDENHEIEKIENLKNKIK